MKQPLQVIPKEIFLIFINIEVIVNWNILMAHISYLHLKLNSFIDVYSFPF